jgi:SulP family sulfate permease
LIAGLPPSAALQSCWISNIITAVVGGRPGMITSASGLTAMLLYRLVRTDTVVEESGIMFVPYVIIFAGILQCIAALIGLGRLVSAFPAVVVVGMVNAMALFILALQFRYAKVFPLTEEEINNGWNVDDGTAPAVEISWNIALFSYYGVDIEWITPTLDLGIFAGEVATSFLISMFLPKLTKCLPATLVSVLVVVGVEFGLVRMFGAGTPLIGDYGGTHVSCIFFPCVS